MSLFWKCGAVLTVAAVLVVGVVIGASLNTKVGAADKERKVVAGAADKEKKVVAVAADKAPAGLRYTVVETEGVHLIVTDNQSNILYFYAIEEGEKPGADLHLRGTADLTQVGKPTIKPTLINPRKKR